MQTDRYFLLVFMFIHLIFKGKNHMVIKDDFNSKKGYIKTWALNNY